jgi:chain length determinant protein tyrosine kinase EpsG
MNDKSDISPQSIGDIIAKINNLDADHIETIARFQKEKGLKFGEAAVALGMAKREDVVWALSQQFNYPYQGQEPEAVSSELVVATDPFDETAEFFRDVRAQMLSNVFNRQDERRLALAVCSADTGDGKTFFAANLAVAFSQLPGRTLLIDADLRSPRLQDIFGIGRGTPGLSSVLAGRSEVNVVKPVDSLPNLYLLPAGIVPPNPLELVQGPTFEHMIASVCSRFEHVIVDTPAAAHGADARVIAPKCGAALTLARKGITEVASLKRLSANLQKSCEVFCGVLLNDYAAR